jgi:hypothetical protein
MAHGLRTVNSLKNRLYSENSSAITLNHAQFRLRFLINTGAFSAFTRIGNDYAAQTSADTLYFGLKAGQRAALMLKLW